jgi:hypothetical protein
VDLFGGPLGTAVGRGQYTPVGTVEQGKNRILIQEWDFPFLSSFLSSFHMRFPFFLSLFFAGAAKITCE